MENLSLNISFIIIVGIVLLGRFLNQRFKVPLVHSLIILSFSAHSLGWIKLFDENNILPAFFFLIPIILLNDVLHLKFNDVKKYKKEIFLLAFVGIIISVLITAFTAYLLNLLGTNVVFGSYLAIATIITATDAISVSNIFSQFKSISHQTKFLMESESLGNDGTTIVLFYFIALPWMLTGTFDFSSIPLIAVKVFAISTGIGFIVGYSGYILLKQFSNRYEEFLITVVTVYLAFVIAEWIHVAGVFALIVSGMTLNTFILKDISKSKKTVSAEIQNSQKYRPQTLFMNMKAFRKVATTSEGHKDTMNLVADFGFIAVTILFVGLSELINPSSLVTYWREIFLFFVISTVSRGFSLSLFIGFSKYLKVVRLSLNAWVLLTLAGIKGGVSIIMLYSIPSNYPLLELFQAIVMGLIISTIFIYGLSLLVYITLKETKKA